jgi:RNA polymerase sigma-B factor
MTEDSRTRLIEQYLPLVTNLARRFDHRGEQLEDLVQVGAVGLIKAVDRYEPGRGVTLGAFAAPTIAGEIQRHLRDRTWPLTVPRRLRETRPLTDFVDSSTSAEESGAPGDAERDRERGEDRALLALALQGLDGRKRQLLHLRFFEDLNQAEIADRLGVSQPQVSRLLQKALDALRGEIGEAA